MKRPRSPHARGIQMFVRKQLSLLAMSLVVTVGQTSLWAQTTLHGQLKGRTYIDDKIQVTAPSGWAIESSNGAVLHKGRYILSLCSYCGQASGIQGGRFSEIDVLVQPWARKEEPSGSCGKQEIGGRTGKLDRQDLYYARPAGGHSSYRNGGGVVRHPSYPQNALVWLLLHTAMQGR